MKTRLVALLVAWLVAPLAWLVALPLHAAEATQPCRVPGLEHEVRCGQVERLLDPARPAGPKIAVHYVVVPAMARRKLPDPVFLLAGGPGQSAVALAPTAMRLFARLNNRRDIVFVDQRGTGRSAPLYCEDTRGAPLAELADSRRAIERLMDCKAKLLTLPHVKQASDLRFFTTVLATQDLEAVRLQLGAPRINLVGASYGTRAALDYMRQFAPRVRRVVLDGVAPPDMVLPAAVSPDAQAAFDAMQAACAEAPACGKAYPKLLADWDALLQSLPRRVTAVHPFTGQPEEFTLTREWLLGAVRGALYVPAFAAVLPAAIGQAAQGRFDALAGLTALGASGRASRLAMGEHFSVVCAEDVPRMAQAPEVPGGDFGRDLAKVYEQVCAQWPRGEVPAAFYNVPRFNEPVLVLSGGLDPATPPRHGGRIAVALGPAAQHVVVPHAGHGLLSIGCTPDVVFRFFDAADDTPPETVTQAAFADAACVLSIPRPPMLVPPSGAAAGTP